MVIGEMDLTSGSEGLVVPKDLIGVAEAAVILKFSRQRVSHLVRAPNERFRFPAPIARLACGPLWVRQEVERFRDGRSRHGGRPVGEPTGLVSGVA